MPRQNGVYVEPAGTKGTPNTTIQSSPYNAFVDDLVADANAARPISAGGTGATNATAARSALGLAIGTHVQAYDALLQSISALQTAAEGNQLVYTTATDVAALTTITAFGRSLIDDADAAAARTTLGLGSIAALNSVNNGNWSGDDLDIANGGTGASTAAAARTNLGLVAIASTGSASDLTAGTLPNARISGAYDGITNLSMTGTLAITSASPTINFIDTTAGSYNTRLIVDANNLYLQKQADGTSTWTTFMQFEMDTTNSYANGSQILTAVNHPHVNLGTTAATARTALGLGGLSLLNITDLGYTGSSASNTNYPVGEVLAVTNLSVNRAEANGVWISTANAMDFQGVADGAQLAGTWRGRGRVNNGNHTMRRVG